MFSISDASAFEKKILPSFWIVKLDPSRETNRVWL
jgi:hypothetical protein